MVSTTSGMIEVRWHGRGGQGAKSASAILAEVLFEGGRHVQAFPEYGAERQGAPIRAYNRISSRPIRRRCGVQNPDVVVVTDPTLSVSANPSEGCREDAIYIVNTPEDASSLRARLGLSDSATVLAVDATGITLEELGQNRPHAPLLGALSHVFSDVSAEDFADHFTRKMKSLPPEALEANRRAIMRGREEAVTV
ncbi:MAG: 2-oxoacid:acceptor oxidoreductase family protein [Synergistaceae bacterium]|jgi:pyruvate ferredoxin oxidoreductase gamma subunit|nr:2-oxoacid:acceptor oxidoreductase family protein [Synergistaceae bacterium]